MNPDLTDKIQDAPQRVEQIKHLQNLVANLKRDLDDVHESRDRARREVISFAKKARNLERAVTQALNQIKDSNGSITQAQCAILSDALLEGLSKSKNF